MGDAASELTLLSDLAPGTYFGLSEGYWTGLPIPQLQRYVLMRTWPAPEMSRPGCVWSHALLLETSWFEDIEDLSVLQGLVRRPRAVFDYSSYLRQLMFDVDGASSTSEASRIGSDSTLRILAPLYDEKGGVLDVEEPGIADAEIFAVWSQQWPRLRRNFKFQTAARRDESPLSARFDLSLRLRRPLDSPQASPSSRWIHIAAADLESFSDHSLRHFLWRYGADVRRQRGSFRPLCEIFILDREGLGRSNIEFSNVAKWFPDRDDAARLKQDLVDGILLEEYQLDTLSFLLKEDRGQSFPPLTHRGEERLLKFWPNRSAEMLELAEFAVVQRDEFSTPVGDAILRAIPASDFWAVTEGFPYVRNSMIEMNPNLLDSEAIVGLDSTYLIGLLKRVPIDHSVGSLVVRRLALRADVGVANEIVQLFPTQGAAEIILAANEYGPQAVGAWIRASLKEPHRLLNERTMFAVRRTSILYYLAEELKWISSITKRESCNPWLSGTANAAEDLGTDDTLVLNSFLVALALECGERSGQLLLERFFSSVHDRILNWYLPWKANDMLISRLPDLGWARNWDVAHRLRLGVALAYVRHSFDPDSFARLSDDGRVRDSLRSAAREIAGGGPYADSIK